MTASLASKLALVPLPEDGVWRVGRAKHPIYWQRPDQASAPAGASVSVGGPDGGRFDSYFGTYAVSYFGTTRQACYAEALAPLRPSPRSRDRVQPQWQTNGFMGPGSIAADWRHQRLLVRASSDGSALPFVDVARSRTVAVLARDRRLAQMLELHGVAGDVDLATLVGTTRAVTRMISQILYDAVDDDEEEDYLFGGIRYVSRHGDDLECWAVFEGTPIVEVDRRPIEKDDPDLCEVAKMFGLHIH